MKTEPFDPGESAKLAVGHAQADNDSLRAENARLEEEYLRKAELLVKVQRERDALQARVEEAERVSEGLHAAVLMGSEYTKELEALAERRKEALERIAKGRMDIGGKDEAMPRAVMMSEARATIDEAKR